MKVYNEEYEAIGNVNEPKINGTYYDLKGNLVENNEVYRLFLDEHPDTHEKICIRSDRWKRKIHFCWGDFKQKTISEMENEFMDRNICQYMTYTYCSRSFIPISLNILRKLASDDIIDEFYLQYKEIHKINIDFKHRNDKEELKKLRNKLIVSSNYNLLIDYLNDLSTFYKLLADKRFDGLINCIIKLR